MPRAEKLFAAPDDACEGRRKVKVILRVNQLPFSPEEIHVPW